MLRKNFEKTRNLSEYLFNNKKNSCWTVHTLKSVLTSEVIGTYKENERAKIHKYCFLIKIKISRHTNYNNYMFSGKQYSEVL